jgi:hypothetical protein
MPRLTMLHPLLQRVPRQAWASLALTGVLMVVAVVGVSTAWGLSTDGALGAAPLPTTATPTPMPTPSPTLTATPTRPPRPTIRTTTKPPGTRTATTAATTKAPGVEVWKLASGGTGIVGASGTLYTYRVEVEQATKLNADAVAQIVDQTLAAPRGWTNEGKRFRRVSSGSVNMVIRVAIPATVDKLCRPLLTGGVVSCRNGNLVMINLTRWNTGVKAFGSDVAGYRQLVINHEVGHRIGHSGHPKCPGQGKPAPVMMQVYYTGLQGCVKNLYPFAEDGTYIG